MEMIVTGLNATQVLSNRTPELWCIIRTMYDLVYIGILEVGYNNVFDEASSFSCSDRIMPFSG